MAISSTSFNSKTAVAAGKKGKRRALDAKLYEEAQGLMKEGITKEQGINRTLITMALIGNIDAMKLYYDRVYGKPKNSPTNEIDLTQNVQIVFHPALKDV